MPTWLGSVQEIYDKTNEESKRHIGLVKQRANMDKIKYQRLSRRRKINFDLRGNVPEQISLASKQFLAEEHRKLLTERNCERL